MDQDQIDAIMAIVKKQHDSVKDMKLYVERLLKEQREHESNLMNRIQAETRRVVESQVSEAIKPLTTPVQQVIHQFNAIRWQPFVYITFSGIIFITALIWLLIWWLPSYHKIEQGKADARKYQLDYGVCNGENCIRVMKNKCGFGVDGDYCVVDPK